MATNPRKTTVTRKVTEDDLILGAKDEVFTVEVVDYQHKKVKYKITILANDRKITADGQSIDFFIGSKNKEAREQLKSGAKKVYTKDSAGNEIYKIEVVE